MVSRLSGVHAVRGSVCPRRCLGIPSLLRAYPVASFLVRVGLTVLLVNGAAFVDVAAPEPPRVGGAGIDSVAPSTVSDDLTDDGAPFVGCRCVLGTHGPLPELTEVNTGIQPFDWRLRHKEVQ